MYQLVCLMLNEKIRDADQNINLYRFMGWGNEWPLMWRNILIKALTEHQLNFFNRE